MDSCTLTAKFSFCVFIFSTENAMICHETKDNARLVDLYPFLKHHNNSGIFSLYKSYFTGITILSYVLASQTQQ